MKRVINLAGEPFAARRIEKMIANVFSQTMTDGPMGMTHDEAWVTAEGRRLLVNRMEEAHVRACLGMILRRLRKRAVAEMTTDGRVFFRRKPKLTHSPDGC
jgi:hypothetical protein